MIPIAQIMKQTVVNANTIAGLYEYRKSEF